MMQVGLEKVGFKRQRVMLFPVNCFLMFNLIWCERLVPIVSAWVTEFLLSV